MNLPVQLGVMQINLNLTSKDPGMKNGNELVEMKFQSHNAHPRQTSQGVTDIERNA